MRVVADSIGDVVRRARLESGLSKTDFANAAGTTRAAIDEYEKGLRIPRVDSLVRIVAPAGQQLHIEDVEPVVANVVGRSLASFGDSVDVDDSQWTWRTLIGDFVANEFAPALAAERAALVIDEPAGTDSSQWNTFLAALAEHLCFHAQIEAPAWVFSDGRALLDHWWWPVHGVLPSMRSAALAWSPAAFRRRRIAIDGRELAVIVP